jgi:hypothetical protein
MNHIVYRIILFDHASPLEPLDIWEKEGKSSQGSLKAKHIASLLICNTHILSLVAEKGNGVAKKNYVTQEPKWAQPTASWEVSYHTRNEGTTCQFGASEFKP